MKAPIVYFGGKRRVAAEVWAALGDVDNAAVRKAAEAITARGDLVTVPSLRAEMASRRRPEPTPSQSEAWDCDCKQQGATVLLCDYHRELGLRAIAAFRQVMTARKEAP